MTSFELAVWLYRGADWYVPDPKGPHVAREAWTVKFEPKVMTALDGLTDERRQAGGRERRPRRRRRGGRGGRTRQFGDHVTAAASQPYYLDVTHPQANKGVVARYLAQRYELVARCRSPPSATCPTTS